MCKNLLLQVGTIQFSTVRKGLWHLFLSPILMRGRGSSFNIYTGTIPLYDQCAKLKKDCASRGTEHSPHHNILLYTIENTLDSAIFFPF